LPWVGGTSVNEEVLKAGLAWHYKKYAQERHLAELEDEASEKKISLRTVPVVCHHKTLEKDDFPDFTVWQHLLQWDPGKPERGRRTLKNGQLCQSGF